MVITLGTNSRGQAAVHVAGNIGDKGLCYMMLKLAEDEVRKFSEPKIAGPNGHGFPFIGGRRNRG